MRQGVSKERWVDAYIGLGSNIEPRAKYIERAVNLMNDHPQIEVIAVSSIYQTAPVGGPEGQPDFLNGVAKIQTQLRPDALYDTLHAFEADLGRKRTVSWGPRTIDLDILLYGDEIISTERLTVPHPMMHQRRFVMQGLAELAPDLEHPILEMSAKTILESLGDDA